MMILVCVIESLLSSEHPRGRDDSTEIVTQSVYVLKAKAMLLVNNMSSPMGLLGTAVLCWQ